METNFFNTNLKYLRDKHGMEQADLQELLNFKSSSTVSEWEKGLRLPNAGTLSEIANIFKITIDDLMHKDLANHNIIDEDLTIAAHLEGEELTDKEREQIIKYAEFIISQRK